MTTHSSTESSSLLPISASSFPLHTVSERRDSIITAVVEDEAPVGNATMFQTIVNMAKACMGPGFLVLPYAAKQGGLGLHTFGLLAIALWNIYVVQRLCQCLDYLPIHQPTISTPLPTRTRKHKRPTALYPNPPPEGTAMFGQVVWYAVGHKGLLALDLLMLLFLLGILITYINAMRSFLRDSPLSTGSDVMDALVLVAIMGPLSSVPHYGFLSKASVLGLSVLAATFVVIAIYGLQQQQQQQQQQQSALLHVESSSLHWSPMDGLYGTSQWFGSVVFSFGVAPLTYNFRSSMEDPKQMVPAASYALTGVAVTYMAIGIFFCALFPNLHGDLLQVLPTKGIWPGITRLAMVIVGLTTVPLLVVPCGELVEGKLIPHLQVVPQDEQHVRRRILFRCGICLFAVGVSLYVPGFVDVLSFVGCCCVAMLGFCIPPLLHALLGYQARNHQPMHYGSMLLDGAMLAWGFFAMIVSTTYTFRQISTSVGGGE